MLLKSESNTPKLIEISKPKFSHSVSASIETLIRTSWVLSPIITTTESSQRLYNGACEAQSDAFKRSNHRDSKTPVSEIISSVPISFQDVVIANQRPCFRRSSAPSRNLHRNRWNPYHHPLSLSAVIIYRNSHSLTWTLVK